MNNTNFDKKQMFINLRADGKTLNEISKELQVCRQTLCNWQKEFSKEIKNLKTLNIESLIKSYSYDKENRLKQLLQKQKAISETFDNYDLTALNFKDLLQYYEIVTRQINAIAENLNLEYETSIYDLEVNNSETKSIPLE